jgi:epoxyqueuosine reductase
MSLMDELHDHVSRAGIDLLGVTSPRSFFTGKERIEINPRRYMPGAEAVVVSACYMYGIDTPEPSQYDVPRGRFGPWTRAAMGAVRYGSGIVRSFLEAHGYTAIAADLPFKMAAVRSGIALYGKNTIIHADGYGSYLKLSGVITNAPLDCVDRPLDMSDCGDCTECITACPTGALDRPYTLQREKCICAWMWGMPIPYDYRDKAGNYIFRCGYCQEACPKNENLTKRKSIPFVIDGMSDFPELIPLLIGDREYYKETLPEFVLLAGVETVRRNVAIALGNCGDPLAVPALVETLQSPVAAVRCAVAWALGRIGGADAATALKGAFEGEQERNVRGEIEKAIHHLTMYERG